MKISQLYSGSLPVLSSETSADLMTYENKCAERILFRSLDRKAVECTLQNLSHPDFLPTGICTRNNTVLGGSRCVQDPGPRVCARRSDLRSAPDGWCSSTALWFVVWCFSSVFYIFFLPGPSSRFPCLPCLLCCHFLAVCSPLNRDQCRPPITRVDFAGS
ncbi:hypothetical protein M011DRAFT_290355 [Sporormia fimetaria CBS 119925]|uniref:Uncharacterized protein n=1 Tax=Sporormia fimetaria CBS 119925 TaxID=1340428 RepID=A0A6A6UY39_9PLEO|nr:hypothetical protein M011DRAFT_290355 [Sporormia fimetaria CBS 119925]